MYGSRNIHIITRRFNSIEEQGKKTNLLFIIVLGMSLLASSVSGGAYAGNADSSRANLSDAKLSSINLDRADVSNADVYTFYNAGWTPELRAYYFDVIKAALKASQKDYGPFRLEKYNKELSLLRAAKEIDRGALFNIRVTTSKHATKPNTASARSCSSVDSRHIRQKGYVCFPFPVLHGLLGLRQLIIRYDDQSQFMDTRTFVEFQQFSAGLAQQWEEVALFQSRGLSVVNANSSESLINMLKQKRFDYIPLSVLEAHNWLEPNDGLEFAENVLIYYPIKIYLTISRNQGRLAERLQYGIEKIESSGKRHALFKEAFSESLVTLASNKNDIFVVVNNPSLSAQENASIYDEFLESKIVSPSRVFKPELIFNN